MLQDNEKLDALTYLFEGKTRQVCDRVVCCNKCGLPLHNELKGGEYIISYYSLSDIFEHVRDNKAFVEAVTCDVCYSIKEVKYTLDKVVGNHVVIKVEEKKGSVCNG